MEKTLKAADSLGAPRVYIKMLVELEVGFHAVYTCTAILRAEIARLLGVPSLPAPKSGLRSCIPMSLLAGHTAAHVTGGVSSTQLAVHVVIGKLGAQSSPVKALGLFPMLANMELYRGSEPHNLQTGHACQKAVATFEAQA